jgi:hypothetical protein
MSLVLYRRHVKSCKVHKKRLPAEAKRLFLACDCPIWMCGRTKTGVVPRQSTGLSDLAQAEELKAKLLADGKEESIRGYRIDECIDNYLVSRKHELGAKTIQQHKLLLARLAPTVNELALVT